MCLKNRVFVVANIMCGSLLSLRKANCILSKKLTEICERAVSDNDERLKLSAEILQEYYDADKERLRRIEDKARSNVLGIALAVSVLSAGTGMFTKTGLLGGESLWFQVISAICMSIAMLLLLLSGYFALQGYKLGMFYSPDLQDRPELTSESKWKQTLIEYIERNRILILIRGNYLTASMDCLRNGLTMLFVLALLGAFSIIF